VAHVSFGAMRSPQFAVVAIWSRLRSDSISFPLGALFCWLFLFLHGLQCMYVHFSAGVLQTYLCVCESEAAALSWPKKGFALSPLSLSPGATLFLFLWFFLELAIILAL